MVIVLLLYCLVAFRRTKIAKWMNAYTARCLEMRCLDFVSIEEENCRGRNQNIEIVSPMRLY